MRETVRAGADLVLVVGSRNSSNSNRMVEVAQASGADSYLIDNVSELDPVWLDGKRHIALTAGASAPEVLVQEVATALVGAGYARGGEEEPVGRGRLLRVAPGGPPEGLPRPAGPLQRAQAALQTGRWG